MRIQIKKPVNLILGIVLGLFIAFFIFIEKNLLLYYFEYTNLSISIPLVNGLAIALSVIQFVFIILKINQIKKNGLALYYVLAIVLAFFFSFLLFYIGVSIFGIFVSKMNLLKFLSSDVGGFILINLSHVFIVCLFGAFIGAFIGFTKHKVKYIEYISNGIKKIETDGFGNTLDVRGHDELSELSTSINNMSLKLKEKMDSEKRYEQNKTELITNVSHDLRTPLTSIIGYVELLKENGFENKQNFDEYIDIVDQRLKGLHVLINELFEYTKLTGATNTLNYSEADIASLVNHIATEYTYTLSKHGHLLVSELKVPSLILSMDVDKIVRVLQNLLDNARKYSVKNSPITLTLYEDCDSIYITVTNETSTLHKDDLDYIFERFYKCDKARSEQDSSGLGLSIVSRIVELHGGQISAQLEGNLITFKVMLPKHPPLKLK